MSDTTEQKKKVEALLFSSGRSMKLEEISRLTRISEEQLKQLLEELKKDYDSRDSSLVMIEESGRWKLTTKEQYLNLVRKIVTQTELSKTLMETLAIIAFKYPIKQSELIKIRTNKAYDHLRELEEAGYISRQKFGRTKLIKLSDKFFGYFDLPPEKLKEKFQDFEGIAKAIEAKEEETKKIKQEQKKAAEDAGKEKKAMEEGVGISEEEEKEIEEKLKKPGIELIDEQGEKHKLDIVDEKPVQEEKQKVGWLEVFDEEPENEEKAAKERGKEEKEEQIKEELEETGQIEEENKKETEPKKEAEEEIEPEVKKRVEEILHPKKTEKEPAVEDEFEKLIHPKKEEEE